MNWKVPLSDVTVDEEEVQAVSDVLRSGWLTQGEQVAAFEKSFAEMLGANHAVAVTNGTAALHLAYHAAGLGSGDEFIVPALTFVATMAAGLQCGATPVLADSVSQDDLTVSADDIERKITSRTRLIVSMPYGGFCPDMERIETLARERGIALVEDACHAPLARLGERCIGMFGQAGTFSFFGNKNMTTGEGGMIVCSDEAMARRLRALRSHGMTTVTWDRHRGHAADYDVAEAGFNYRLDEVRAAIGRVQVAKLPEATKRRVSAAEKLRKAIDGLGIDGLEVPFTNPRGESVHHLFVILLPPEVDRRVFRERMAENGVQTSMHYPLLHRLALSQKVLKGEVLVPVVESIEPRLVTLPMGAHLDDAAIGLIGESVGRAISKDVL